MKASIVICTFNRCNAINNVIKTVINQNIDILYEILIIDNKSTDKTQEVIHETTEKSTIPIKYIYEGKQGLSFARNKGVQEAIGEIILFIDDDAVAEKNWINSHMSAYTDSRVFCAGGPIKPIWALERPVWLTDDVLAYLSVNEYKNLYETKTFNEPTYPWGTNISFRKSVFSTYGMFPTNLGRSGTNLVSNEEYFLCKKIEASGKIVRFIPEAIVHHHIPAERMNRLWFYRRAYAQGVSDAILDWEFNTDSYDVLEKIFNRIEEYRKEAKKKNENEIYMKCKKRRIYGYLNQVNNIYINNKTDKEKVKIISQIIYLISNRHNKYESYIENIEKNMNEMLNSKIWKWTKMFRSFGNLNFGKKK